MILTDRERSSGAQAFEGGVTPVEEMADDNGSELTRQVLTSMLAIAMRFNLGGLLCIGGIVALVLLATSSGKVARRCSRCSEVNREAAVFCAQCGTRLPNR